ncbi:uncharacterized protein RCC_05841 [Ramularia collo-cygni]|uniref:Regulator of conidiation rca-1 n=1 Tax=Ramularia collo-cygni TaxID=112498 RepID=A0A2D3VBA8_9PEZI|nr:uncharacterized protein RCC_05841 [Ramularia collo-cygni]CZT19984.1 uncharacterized protein RCC_05841 [Ramularia collo-cygni]
MPQHKRGPWSQQEDQLLLHLVSVHGAHNWVRISSTIQTRSPKQCRERFHQNLKPNLNHDPITPEEGILIEQMVAEMGKRWAEIARRLRGRSDNAVKNWWNGGMNRRRRNNQQRRAEFEVRHQPQIQHQHQQHQHQQQQQQQHQQQQHQQQQQQQQQMQEQHFHMQQQQQPLPNAFHQSMMAPQFFPQQMSQMYNPVQSQNPHNIAIPQNMAQYSRMFDTPIPSPSGYSHMSAERAPSLISDCSSVSARSPHNGPSPIELPPLAGARDDRRHSSAPMMRLEVPGSFAQEVDFSMNGMSMQRYDDMSKTQPMLQEPFMPQQQSLPIPSAYLPSQSRQPSPLHQQHQMAQGYSMPMQRRDSGYPMSSHHLMSNDGKLDPALSTPMLSGQTLDGSPKDKMSLSNLTH